MYSHTTAQAALHPRYYLGVWMLVLCLGAAPLCLAFMWSSDWVTLGLAWSEATSQAQVNSRLQASRGALLSPDWVRVWLWLCGLFFSVAVGMLGSSCSVGLCHGNCTNSSLSAIIQCIWRPVHLTEITSSSFLLRLPPKSCWVSREALELTRIFSDELQPYVFSHRITHRVMQGDSMKGCTLFQIIVS